MKKKLALLLAAVMVAGMIPVTAMAASKNQISRVLTMTQDSWTNGENELVITEQDGLTASGLTGGKMTFALNLTGAKWGNVNGSGEEYPVADMNNAEATLIQVIDTDTDTAMGGATVTVDRITNTMKTITISGLNPGDKPKIIIPIYAQVTGTDTAEIEIDGMESNLRSETLTFAKIVTGATTASIEAVTTIDTATKEIKPIVIKENVAGTIKNQKLTLRLYGNFEFSQAALAGISVKDATNGATIATGASWVDEQKIEITLAGVNAAEKSQLVISGIDIYATDDAANGDVAEIYVSGAGITSESLEVGKYVEYGVTITVEDKDLPVIYAGEDNTTKTLKVTVKEDIADSWLANRKTTFTFPEGIKIKEVLVTKQTNTNGQFNASATAGNTANSTAGCTDIIGGNTKWTVANNEVSFSNVNLNSAKAATVVFQFVLLAAPDFEGDVVLTVGGAALPEDVELTVATVKPLFTVETDVNEVIIDYRNTEIADLVIKETKAGALTKANDLYLRAEDMRFESGFDYEVVEGDIKIEDVTITNNTNGIIRIDVKSSSVKTPATIKLTGLSLYMNRSLPAGDYRLYSVAGTVAGSLGSNFVNADGAESPTRFDMGSYTLMDDFVTIVTAGRDQDDSTFTTTVTVTIGANTMMAGTKTIELDAPAYISNGYTMLPVRAVSEALSGAAQVSWDDATKTVIIFFGSRIIKMTIGSKEMIINGTPTTMQAPAEISNDRTFISLRDLAYALGLNDDKIAWDDTTKTATLNKIAE